MLKPQVDIQHQHFICPFTLLTDRRQPPSLQVRPTFFLELLSVPWGRVRRQPHKQNANENYHCNFAFALTEGVILTKHLARIYEKNQYYTMLLQID